MKEDLTAWQRATSPASWYRAQHHVGAASGFVECRPRQSPARGRSIIYAVDFERMSALLLFLTKDCCGGRAEICARSPTPSAAARRRNAAHDLQCSFPLYRQFGALHPGRSDPQQDRKGSLPCLFRRFPTKGEVNPHALDLLKRLGYDTSAFRSKPWDEFASPDHPNLISSSPSATARLARPVRSAGSADDRPLGMPDPAQPKARQPR